MGDAIQKEATAVQKDAMKKTTLLKQVRIIMREKDSQIKSVTEENETLKKRLRGQVTDINSHVAKLERQLHEAKAALTLKEDIKVARSASESHASKRTAHF